MAKRIQIRIHPDGRIEADIKGFKGDACLEYMKMLENVLKAETIDKNYTDEYYDNENVITGHDSVSE